MAVEPNAILENELAEGVRLSKATLWLWSESFAFNPALSRPANRTEVRIFICGCAESLFSKAYRQRH